MTHRKAQMVQMLDKGLLKRDNVETETVPSDNRCPAKDIASNLLSTPTPEMPPDRSGQTEKKQKTLNSCSELCLGFM